MHVLNVVNGVGCRFYLKLGKEAIGSERWKDVFNPRAVHCWLSRTGMSASVLCKKGVNKLCYEF